MCIRDSAFLALRPNYLAYWSLLEDAARRGFHVLDMGRSLAGSNASAFKGQWGGACAPVYQQVAILGAAGSPGNGALRVDNQRGTPGGQWVTRLWPRLPLPVASYLGPKLRQHVPFG